MPQPLVTRPPYGQGRAATPVSESKLPEGEPGGKGLSLDPSIPGSSTHDKPEGDTREFDKAEPGSIYRKDGPDDLAKPQDDPEGDERHHENFKPRLAPPGGRPPGDPTVTDYPYRDDRPNKHWASVDPAFVLGCFLLKTAREVEVRPTPMTRTAATAEQISVGLDPAIQEKAGACSISLKRVDVGNLRWLFAVNCGNGVQVVRLKASRVGNVAKFSKFDLKVACSCPAWQWQGPEHHAQAGGYLDGKPRGTAATPAVKDPGGTHTLCKHVAAVLAHTKSWSIPVAKK